MKQIGSLVAGVLLFTAQAHAASVTHTGLVNLVRVHDSTTYTSPQDWVSVASFPGSGHTCMTALGGKVVLAVRDDEHGKRMLSLATTAMLAGKTVTVSIDDTQKLGSMCYLQTIALNP